MATKHKAQPTLLDDDDARQRQAREIRTLIDALMPDAIADGTHATTIIRLMDRESKLLGLDAPKESKQSTMPLPTIDLTPPQPMP